MNTPHLTTPLPVDKIWHTNWGFAVRQIIAGKSYDYFLYHHIATSPLDCVEQFICPGERREHTYRPRDSIGIPSPLLPGVTAHVCAQLTSTLDLIPLDPNAAIHAVQVIFHQRIAGAIKENQPGLEVQREKLIEGFIRVRSRQVISLLDLPGVIGVCKSLDRNERAE